MKDRFECFLELTSEIHKYVKRIKAEEMASMNLKSGHALCIYYLYKNKNLSLTELSEKCKEDKSSISRAIESLKSEGYIENDGKSGYKRPLKLTDKGLAAGDRLKAKIERILEISDTGVCESDRTVMYSTLEKIAQNLASVCALYDEKN